MKTLLLVFCALSFLSGELHAEPFNKEQLFYLDRMATDSVEIAGEWIEYEEFLGMKEQLSHMPVRGRFFDHYLVEVYGSKEALPRELGNQIHDMAVEKVQAGEKTYYLTLEQRQCLDGLREISVLGIPTTARSKVNIIANLGQAFLVGIPMGIVFSFLRKKIVGLLRFTVAVVVFLSAVAMLSSLAIVDVRQSGGLILVFEIMVLTTLGSWAGFKCMAALETLAEKQAEAQRTAWKHDPC